MKQILQSLKDGTIQLAEIPVPAVKPGHLLIRTDKTLISLGTERMLLKFGRSGWIDKARQQPDKVKQVIRKIKTDGLVPTVQAVMNKLDQPLPLGYCNAGTVLEVGRGVHGFQPGDRVVSNGNHAEVVCVPEHLCAPIPAEVDTTTASFTVLSAIALQGVRLIDPSLGESVAILGLGLIGLLAGQILRANGCRVIGFDPDPEKVALARGFGFEALVLADGLDPVEAGVQFSGGEGVDAVLITAATTSNEPIQQSPRMCRKRGRVVLVGVIGLELSRDDFYKKEISFQVSCSYGPGRYDPAYEQKGLDYPIGFVRWTEQRNFQAILQLMAEKRLSVQGLVSRTIPIGEAQAAYELVEKDPKIMGLVLDYPGPVDMGRRVCLRSGLEAAVGAGGRAGVRAGFKPALTPLGSNAGPNPVPTPPGTASEPIVGFIGAGGFAASTLLPAFAAHGATLHTIASAGGVSGTHLGWKFGFQVSTTDTQELYKDPAVNVAVITTRHDSHARFVLEALAAGKHVFVEKPLCLTRDELQAIREAYAKAAAQGRLLMVGFNRRFSPLVASMKKVLDANPDPKYLTMTVNAGRIPGDHWTQDDDSGGGRILGEGCHFIDLLRFLVGKPIVEVSSTSGRRPSAGKIAPDSAVITLAFADGSLGTIQYFAEGHKDFPKERLEVFQSGKILQLDNFIRVDGYGFEKFRGEKLWAQDKGHKDQVGAFLEAIRKGQPSPIPFDEIVEVTEATFAAAGI